MKMTIEIDCTPQEARAFLGLPDVSGLNDKLVEEMQKRMTANMAMLSPDELIKSWTAFGVGAGLIYGLTRTVNFDIGGAVLRQSLGDALYEGLHLLIVPGEHCRGLDGLCQEGARQVEHLCLRQQGADLGQWGILERRRDPTRKGYGDLEPGSVAASNEDLWLADGDACVL